MAKKISPPRSPSKRTQEKAKAFSAAQSGKTCPSFVKKRKGNYVYAKEGKISKKTLLSLREGDVIRAAPEDTPACNFTIEKLLKHNEAVVYYDWQGVSTVKSFDEFKAELEKAWKDSLKAPRTRKKREPKAKSRAKEGKDWREGTVRMKTLDGVDLCEGLLLGALGITKRELPRGIRFSLYHQPSGFLIVTLPTLRQAQGIGYELHTKFQLPEDLSIVQDPELKSYIEKVRAIASEAEASIRVKAEKLSKEKDENGACDAILGVDFRPVSKKMRDAVKAKLGSPKQPAKKKSSPPKEEKKEPVAQSIEIVLPPAVEEEKNPLNYDIHYFETFEDRDEKSAAFEKIVKPYIQEDDDKDFLYILDGLFKLLYNSRNIVDFPAFAIIERGRRKGSLEIVRMDDLLEKKIDIPLSILVIQGNSKIGRWLEAVRESLSQARIELAKRKEARKEEKNPLSYDIQYFEAFKKRDEKFAAFEEIIKPYIREDDDKDFLEILEVLFFKLLNHPRGMEFPAFAIVERGRRKGSLDIVGMLDLLKMKIYVPLSTLVVQENSKIGRWIEAVRESIAEARIKLAKREEARKQPSLFDPVFEKYTTKKGKVLDVWRIPYAGDLAKEDYQSIDPDVVAKVQAKGAWLDNKAGWRTKHKTDALLLRDALKKAFPQSTEATETIEEKEEAPQSEAAKTEIVISIEPQEEAPTKEEAQKAAPEKAVGPKVDLPELPLQKSRYTREEIFAIIKTMMSHLTHDFEKPYGSAHAMLGYNPKHTRYAAENGKVWFLFKYAHGGDGSTSGPRRKRSNTWAKITLTTDDLYDLELFQRDSKTFDFNSFFRVEGIQNTQLREIFERETGMITKMPVIRQAPPKAPEAEAKKPPPAPPKEAPKQEIEIKLEEALPSKPPRAKEEKEDAPEAKSRKGSQRAETRPAKASTPPAKPSQEAIDRAAKSTYEKLKGKFEAPVVTFFDSDLWTAKERTDANLAALRLLSDLEAAKSAGAARTGWDLTQQERETLAKYSGWGGLSIEKVQSKIPANLPMPSIAGLQHEYYTPSPVVLAVAKAIKPMIQTLPRREDNRIIALEPSVGSGRFIQATSVEGLDQDLQWIAAEYSPLSAMILSYLRPDIDLNEGMFESFLMERGPELENQIGLVLANPPYGKRGKESLVDTDSFYKEANAYPYFLRRSLDLLAKGGVGVFLIPSGFLSGTGQASRKLRHKVLLRHHISAAFRLPSGIFPGAELVLDLIFFRARGGELKKVAESDNFILQGKYYKEYPSHVLGEEVGIDEEGKKARFGYQIKGEFTGLPAFSERPIEDFDVTPFRVFDKPLKKYQAVERVVEVEEDAELVIQQAQELGMRVDRYLALLAKGDPKALSIWPDLTTDLLLWTSMNGNPWENSELLALNKKKNQAARRFLDAFQKTGTLIDGIGKEPELSEKITFQINDFEGIANYLYRRDKGLQLIDFVEFYAEKFKQSEESARSAVMAALPSLLGGGWYWEDEGIVPSQHYLSGDLWPKLDRVSALIESMKSQNSDLLYGFLSLESLEAQKKMILDAIKPESIENLYNESPQEGWMPVHVLRDFIIEYLHYGKNTISFKRYNRDTHEYEDTEEEIEVERKDGLVQLVGLSYAKGETPPVFNEFISWLNYDYARMNISELRGGRRTEDKKPKLVVEYGEKMKKMFSQFLRSSFHLHADIEEAYNRQLRGFVIPTYSQAPISIARWNESEVQLKPHQNAGARRVLDNRGGLVAFDVGVGKTYTGAAIIAKAREEGWAKRPVVILPNSILFKWRDDLKKALPDFRVVFIGANEYIATSGKDKGKTVSQTDTPEERGQKWTRFQLGEYDVALVSYSTFYRNQLNVEAVNEYVAGVQAILRQMNIDKRKDTDKQLTERQRALKELGVETWVAERLALSPNETYDNGPAWDDLGIDLLMVDEAQNFKNLYMPQPRGEHGKVPKFMGSGGERITKRAWQLDFRAAAVRKKTGAGIVLLSATPAKNSPLEFYNIYNYIDPKIWERLGISNPEQFVERFIKIQETEVIGSSLNVELADAVVGFKNLHELRDVIMRYGEFKTAKEVGLKVPEGKINKVEVYMTEEQEEIYVEVYEKMMEMLEKSRFEKKEDKGGKGESYLGYFQNLSMCAIHPKLTYPEDRKDFAPTFAAAMTANVDYESPKISACADNIARSVAEDCGHIVFCDLVTVHAFLVRALVARGIKRERIAVLNAETAKSPRTRQQIAADFNGVNVKLSDEALEDTEDSDDEVERVPPKYDVVIANAVAYEGIDLQRRTCEIHHLDLPWEPMTLQQRNGRAIRQKNIHDTVIINYYLAKHSTDGMRFNTIYGKAGWMGEMLSSQNRETNNPAAQSQLDPVEMLIQLSRDPEKTRVLLEKQRDLIKTKQRRKILKQAEDLVFSLKMKRNAMRVQNDPKRIQKLQRQIDIDADLLGDVDSSIVPWAKVAASYAKSTEVEFLEYFVSDEDLVEKKISREDIAFPILWDGAVFEVSEGKYSYKYEVGIDFELNEKGFERRNSYLRKRGESEAKVNHGYSRMEEILEELLPQHLSAETQEDLEKAKESFKFRISRWNGISPKEAFLGHSRSFSEMLWREFKGVLLPAFQKRAEHDKKNKKNEYFVPLSRDGVLEVWKLSDVLEKKVPEDLVIPPSKVGFSIVISLLRQSELSYSQVSKMMSSWFEFRYPEVLHSQINDKEMMIEKAYSRELEQLYSQVRLVRREANDLEFKLKQLTLQEKDTKKESKAFEKALKTTAEIDGKIEYLRSAAGRRAWVKENSTRLDEEFAKRKKELEDGLFQMNPGRSKRPKQKKGPKR